MDSIRLCDLHDLDINAIAVCSLGQHPDPEACLTAMRQRSCQTQIDKSRLLNSGDKV
jgi:hypothetical protein